MGPVGEQKTKPTQHTVKELRGLGINPHMLVCRSKSPLIDETRNKISAFCHVPPEAVVSAHDVSTSTRFLLCSSRRGNEHAGRQVWFRNTCQEESAR